MNYKILIDPSHGGEDYGIVKNDLKAKDINLELAEHLSNRLNEFKIPNQLIREKDETISHEQRLNAINNLIKDKKIIVLVIDINNLNDEIIYSLKENGELANLIAKELSMLNNNIRAMKKRLPSNPASDFHYLLREARSYSPIFINYKVNNEDRKIIFDDLKKYIEGIVKGITNFLNIEYVEEVKEGQYKVKQGDTIYSIAKKFNIPLEELKTKNKLNNNTIKINQLIQIADVIEEEEKEVRIPEVIEEQKQEEKLHHVTTGETLYVIATMYNTTPDKIRDVNNLLSDEISVNQILLIPNN